MSKHSNIWAFLYELHNLYSSQNIQMRSAHNVVHIGNMRSAHNVACMGDMRSVHNVAHVGQKRSARHVTCGTYEKCIHYVYWS
jgi:hypothetical protein